MAKTFRAFLVLWILCLFTGFFTSNQLFAEDKPDTPICQRYTYSVIYLDDEGRPPEYVKIYFNGKMIDMDQASSKASLGKEDYQKGVRYKHKYVPTKPGSNFTFLKPLRMPYKKRYSVKKLKNL